MKMSTGATVDNKQNSLNSRFAKHNYIFSDPVNQVQQFQVEEDRKENLILQGFMEAPWEVPEIKCLFNCRFDFL